MQHVTRINNDVPRITFDIDPTSIMVHDLQSIGCGCDKECDEIDIFVGCRTNRSFGSVISNGRIVNDAHDGVAFLTHFAKPFLWFAKVLAASRKNVLWEGFHLVEQTIDDWFELGGILLRPYICWICWGVSLARMSSSILPKFLQVRGIIVFCMFYTKRCVASLVSDFWLKVGLFDRFGQGKERIPLLVGFINQLEIDAVVFQRKESNLLEGVTDCFDKTCLLFLIAWAVCEINGWNLSGHNHHWFPKSLISDFREKAQHFDVDPNHGDKKSKCSPPFSSLRRVVADASLDEVEIKDEIEWGNTKNEQGHENSNWAWGMEEWDTDCREHGEKEGDDIQCGHCHCEAYDRCLESGCRLDDLCRPKEIIKPRLPDVPTETVTRAVSIVIPNRTPIFCIVPS